VKVDVTKARSEHWDMKPEAGKWWFAVSGWREAGSFDTAEEAEEHGRAFALKVGPFRRNHCIHIGQYVHHVYLGPTQFTISLSPEGPKT
jgi:hypothetical protein